MLVDVLWFAMGAGYGAFGLWAMIWAEARYAPLLGALVGERLPGALLALAVWPLVIVALAVLRMRRRGS